MLSIIRLLNVHLLALKNVCKLKISGWKCTVYIQAWGKVLWLHISFPWNLLYCEKHFKYENKRRNQSIPFTFLQLTLFLFLFQLTLFKPGILPQWPCVHSCFLMKCRHRPSLWRKPQQSSFTLARNLCSVGHLIDRHYTSNGLQFQTMVLVFTRFENSSMNYTGPQVLPARSIPELAGSSW